MRSARHATLLLLAIAALGSASCIDPVHDNDVEGLGPEAPGVPRGPLHRAGQPCLTCHGGRGPASPDFSVGGTVYTERGGTAPASNVTVLLIGANGESWVATTNDVGNFWVTKAEWEPVYPMTVGISQGNLAQTMNSRIGRSGSCAECHRGAGNSHQMPAIYLTDTR